MCLSFSDFEGVISEKTIAQFYLVIDINPPSTCGRLQMTSSPVLVLLDKVEFYGNEHRVRRRP